MQKNNNVFMFPVEERYIRLKKKDDFFFKDYIYLYIIFELLKCCKIS